MENGQIIFEAKSSKDGAWYDVGTFEGHRRLSESGDLEVKVHFLGFEAAEDEWVNLHLCVRHRSVSCETSHCVAVLPGDTVLCFQKREDRGAYFDARVLAVQRMRHDLRGCRCRFHVRYEHDQSEEIVPPQNLCRRPETNYRLERMQTDICAPPRDINIELAPNIDIQPKDPRNQKMMNVNTVVPTVSNLEEEDMHGKQNCCNSQGP